MDVSITPFMDVIQSQGSQKSKEPEEHSDSTLPSSMESPVISQRQLPTKSKRRVSGSVFQAAIQKARQTGISAAEISSDDDSSIPSHIESPENTAATRPGLKPKTRMSTNPFDKVLAKKNVTDGDQPHHSSEEEFEDSESFPSNVPSPEIGNARKDPQTKKRPSSTGFKKALANLPNVDEQIVEKPQSSSSTRSKSAEPQNAVAVELGQSQQIVNETSSVRRSRRLHPSESLTPPLPPSTVKVVEETQLSPKEILTQMPSPSSTGEVEQYVTPENIVQYSLSDEDEAVEIDEFSEVGNEQQPPPGQENSASLSFSNRTGNATGDGVADVEEEISPKIATAAESNANQPTFQRTFATTRVSNSDVSEVEDFSPFASSTQLVKKVATENLSDEDEDDSITEAATIPTLAKPAVQNQLTQKENSIHSDSDDLSMSELPSQLDSPAETNIRHRPRLASSKKNVSMTEFLAVLNPKKTNARASGDQPKEQTPTKPQVWIPVEKEGLTSPPEFSSDLESAAELNRAGRRSSAASNARISGTSAAGDSRKGSTAPATTPPKAKTQVPQMPTSPIATSPEAPSELSTHQEQNLTRRQSSRTSKSKLSSSQFIEDQNEKSSRVAASTTTPSKSISRNSGTINKSLSTSKSTGPSASVIIPESEMNSTRRSSRASNARVAASPPPGSSISTIDKTKTKTPSKTPIKQIRVDKTVEAVSESSSSIPEAESNSGRRSRSGLNTRSSTSHVSDDIPPTMEQSPTAKRLSLISGADKTARSFREGQKSKSSISTAPVLEMSNSSTFLQFIQDF